MTQTEVWRTFEPNPGGQVLFLTRSERLRALLGGRGSGKSAVGAVEGLRMVQERPGKPGLIVAPDYPHLVKSTLPEFEAWIPPGHIVDRNKEEKWYLFRNGSKVWYMGVDDPDAPRGMSVNWFWFDEGGVKKTDEAWNVLLATLRVGPDPRGWLTTTPRGRSHWIHDHFVKRTEPGMHWVGHASVYENQEHLDPGYIASLEQSYVGLWREQELHGKFIEGFGTLARREWFAIVPEVPETRRRVRYWDLAATEKKTAKQDPDYTAGARMCRDGEVSYIEHIVKGQLSPDAVEALIVQTAGADGKIAIGIEQEPGASGKSLIRHYEKLLSSYWVQGFRPTGDKVSRAMPWIAQAKAGLVKLVAGDWNEAFLDEVENFPVGSHDDQCDSVSGAFEMLDVAGPPQIFVIG